ncbi:MAG: hypothetical protein A2172_03760 [Candidatus Woykebacteria bacterium RBG_13_40_15]|uniref:Uncharacterized protein n=1 Tax=Candidatus Woykebacteria bacterium RBG_13_40_15 TaxID=1802593 RepID=A0A1G1W6T1_9BACT|nr:MAG: hypothetical protein A2172_03760 [Candidatus Woykebacteria bacterium RBG_13_40_15]
MLIELEEQVLANLIEKKTIKRKDKYRTIFFLAKKVETKHGIRGYSLLDSAIGILTNYRDKLNGKEIEWLEKYIKKESS